MNRGHGREKLAAYAGALLSVIGGFGWLNSEIGKLQAHDEDRMTDVAAIRQDMRDLRAHLPNCQPGSKRE